MVFYWSIDALAYRTRTTNAVRMYPSRFGVWLCSFVVPLQLFCYYDWPSRYTAGGMRLLSITSQQKRCIRFQSICWRIGVEYLYVGIEKFLRVLSSVQKHVYFVLGGGSNWCYFVRKLGESTCNYNNILITVGRAQKYTGVVHGQ